LTASAVIGWERLGEDPIPPQWVLLVEQALASAPALPRRTARPPDSALDQRNRQQSIRFELLISVAGCPGIPRHRLLSAVGEGRVVKATLEECLRSGEMMTAPTLDNRSRPYQGYYLPAAVPPAPEPEMTAEVARQLRYEAGLTRVELASRIGLAHTAIRRYESGARRISPRRAAAIREACSEPPAPKPFETPLEQVLARIDRQPGGALRTDLLYLFKVHGENVLDELLDADVVHWAETFEPDKNGRPQPRRRLRRGSRPAVAPPVGLTAQHFRSLLRTAGRSQSAFARQMGIGQSTVNRWAAEGVPPARKDQVLVAVTEGTEESIGTSEETRALTSGAPFGSPAETSDLDRQTDRLRGERWRSPVDAG
jgi:transcriptional regulator with XRE-family HTH domain